MDEREHRLETGAYVIARRNVAMAMARRGMATTMEVPTSMPVGAMTGAAVPAPAVQPVTPVEAPAPTPAPKPAATVAPPPAPSWKATIDRQNGKKTEAKAGLWSKVVAALNERIRNGE